MIQAEVTLTCLCVLPWVCRVTLQKTQRLVRFRINAFEVGEGSQVGVLESGYTYPPSPCTSLSAFCLIELSMVCSEPFYCEAFHTDASPYKIARVLLKSRF